MMKTYILKFVRWKSAEPYGHCNVKRAEKCRLSTTVFSRAHGTTAHAVQAGRRGPKTTFWINTFPIYWMFLMAQKIKILPSNPINREEI
jgi:hypothetical protein